MNEIIQKENKVLRQIAKEVSVEAIKSRKIEILIRRMQKKVLAKISLKAKRDEK